MRALISVSNKTGIISLAQGFARLGIEILATGGTAKVLREAGIKVIDVSTVTGFSECLSGRVKTLHPLIHAGILARRDDPIHLEELKRQGITPIDFVVVNLYPFRATSAKEGVERTEVIDEIDIGGVALIRAAAKNADSVVVLSDPCDYQLVLAEMVETKEVSLATRRLLQLKAFRYTASYDQAIADYLTPKNSEEVFPEEISLSFTKAQDVRYGENPHQKGAFYRVEPIVPGTIPAARILHGKPLSYNNIRDIDDALALVKEFSEPTAVCSKHGNPCGVASASTIEDAFKKAYAADTVSIFGGIIALNREVTLELAEELSKLFLEAIIAPSFSQEALATLQMKKNIRLLALPQMIAPRKDTHVFRSVSGGMIIQERDDCLLPSEGVKTISKRQATEKEMDDLLFAWKVVKHTKSNAIVIARGKQTLGIGAGQVNRVWSVEEAIAHAHKFFGAIATKGSVLASDAYFPFGDSVTIAAAAGVTAIIEPGGSLRDQESIDATNAHNLTLVFTGMRHFRH